MSPFRFHPSPNNTRPSIHLIEMYKSWLRRWMCWTLICFYRKLFRSDNDEGGGCGGGADGGKKEREFDGVGRSTTHRHSNFSERQKPFPPFISRFVSSCGWRLVDDDVAVVQRQWRWNFSVSGTLIKSNASEWRNATMLWLKRYSPWGYNASVGFSGLCWGWPLFKNDIWEQ